MHQFQSQPFATDPHDPIGPDDAIEMLDAYAASIGAIERTGSAALLRSLLRLRDRLDECLHAVVGQFDAADGYQQDGAVSTTAWLIIHAGHTRRQAATLATTARRLCSLPVTAASWADATLTSGHVSAITSRLSTIALALLAEHETELVPVLANLSVPQAEAAMRYWRAAADAVHHKSEPPEPQSTLQLSRDLDDGWWLTGRLDDETGALLDKALELADPGDRTRPIGERRADALATVCRFFLDHHHDTPARRHRPHLNASIDITKLHQLDGHHHGELIDVRSGEISLNHRAIRRLSCDCVVHRVLRSNAAVIDYGRSTRTIPAPLWNALLLRDRQCRYPGCDRKAGWCEGHHVHHWFDGGPTDLDNLVMLCGHHHRVLHQPGWHAKLLPDGTFDVTTPTGRTITSQPPPPAGSLPLPTIDNAAAAET